MLSYFVQSICNCWLIFLVIFFIVCLFWNFKWNNQESRFLTKILVNILEADNIANVMCGIKNPHPDNFTTYLQVKSSVELLDDFIRLRVKNHVVGKNISTKEVGKKDRRDLTLDYKYKDGRQFCENGENFLEKSFRSCYGWNQKLVTFCI